MTGYNLYGTYNIVMVVIMLYMLVAMLNSSKAEVEMRDGSEILLLVKLNFTSLLLAISLAA